MIRPLLEGFDPARRPLLFSRGILACSALLEEGAASIFQIWQGLRRDRQFALPIPENTSVSWPPGAIAGVPPPGVA
jgi:hypothetical protein